MAEPLGNVGTVLTVGIIQQALDRMRQPAPPPDPQATAEYLRAYHAAIDYMNDPRVSSEDKARFFLEVNRPSWAD